MLQRFAAEKLAKCRVWDKIPKRCTLNFAGNQFSLKHSVWIKSEKASSMPKITSIREAVWIQYRTVTDTRRTANTR